VAYIWYVEPLDKFTNEYLSQALEGEDAIRRIDSNGTNRDVWRTQHRLITRLKKDRKTLGLHYAIYNARSDRATIRLWQFDIPSKRGRNHRLRVKSA